MTDPAGLPLDADDQVILDRLAAVHAMLDPPPADLDARVSFAIALDDLDAEVARQREELAAGVGARSSERTHTITFDADSRAVMITIVGRPDSLVRIDGWLAPAAALPGRAAAARTGRVPGGNRGRGWPVLVRRRPARAGATAGAATRRQHRAARRHPAFTV